MDILLTMAKKIRKTRKIQRKVNIEIELFFSSELSNSVKRIYLLSDQEYCKH